MISGKKWLYSTVYDCYLYKKWWLNDGQVVVKWRWMMVQKMIYLVVQWWFHDLWMVIFMMVQYGSTMLKWWSTVGLMLVTDDSIMLQHDQWWLHDGFSYRYGHYWATFSMINQFSVSLWWFTWCFTQGENYVVDHRDMTSNKQPQNRAVQERFINFAW